MRGATIASVHVLRDSVARRSPSPSAFADAVTGARIDAAVRRGKFLWLLLDGGSLS